MAAASLELGPGGAGPDRLVGRAGVSGAWRRWIGVCRASLAFGSAVPQRRIAQPERRCEEPGRFLRLDALRDASPKLRQPRQLLTRVALGIPRLVDRVA